MSPTFEDVCSLTTCCSVISVSSHLCSAVLTQLSLWAIQTHLPHLEKTHAHKTRLASSCSEDSQIALFLNCDISVPHMRYQALCLRGKRLYRLLQHPPNDSPFIIMIYDTHLLKFYYFCNLIQFVPSYCCSGQCYLMCLSQPLDKDVSPFIMSMMASRLKRPAQYNCVHWHQPSPGLPLLLQCFREDNIGSHL